MDKKKPPRRANLTPRSKVKIQAQATPTKAKVAKKIAKPVSQPLPTSYAEAYALANQNAQIRDLHLNPQTGVYGQSPYTNLLDARLAAEQASRQPEPRTLAEKIAANDERRQRERAKNAERAKRRDFTSRGQEKLESWSEQKARIERETAMNQAAEREAAMAAEAPKPVQRIAPVRNNAPEPRTLAEKVAANNERVQQESARSAEAAKRTELANRGQQQIESWSAKRAREEREAAMAAQEAAEAKPTSMRQISDQAAEQRARDAAKPQTTLRTVKEEAAKKKALESYQERTRSVSAQQAEQQKQFYLAEQQRRQIGEGLASDEEWDAYRRSAKTSPRQATMESQARRPVSAAKPAMANVAEDAAVATEGKLAGRLGGLTKLKGGALAVLLELLMNPQEISERSSAYDKTGRTWDQVDNDRAASQHYFDAFRDDSQYQSGAADATAVHAPIYKAPEMQSPVGRYEYNVSVPPAQYNGGSIAQQLGSTNPDDAYLEEMRKRKLAQDMAASAPRAPRQPSYSTGRWAPAPLFREN